MTQYHGYSKAREFYQPKYDVSNPINAIEDKRTTLYWNPHLKISENGQTKIKYFNSDYSKKHLVVIEGIDERGRLARYEGVIE